MQTVLLQSFHTGDVPEWITQCLSSAHAWAEDKGWTYRFIDDALFDFVPNTIRPKLSDYPPMMADIARLEWMKHVLESERFADRVVWLDADVFVFAPAVIDIDPAFDFAVGRQVWVQQDDDQDLKVYRQVHNAVLTFKRGSPLLEFLVYSIMRMARRLEQISSPQMFGPKLLTALHNITGFDVIESVGMASPLVLHDLAQGEGVAFDHLMEASEHPIGALNLCSSYRGQIRDGVLCDEVLFTDAIAFLQSQKEGLR